MDLTGLVYGPVAYCCEHGNEHWFALKAANFLIDLVTISFTRTVLGAS